MSDGQFSQFTSLTKYVDDLTKQITSMTQEMALLKKQHEFVTITLQPTLPNELTQLYETFRHEKLLFIQEQHDWQVLKQLQQQELTIALTTLKAATGDISTQKSILEQSKQKLAHREVLMNQGISQILQDQYMRKRIRQHLRNRTRSRSKSNSPHPQSQGDSGAKSSNQGMNDVDLSTLSTTTLSPLSTIFTFNNSTRKSSKKDKKEKKEKKDKKDKKRAYKKDKKLSQSHLTPDEKTAYRAERILQKEARRLARKLEKELDKNSFLGEGNMPTVSTTMDTIELMSLNSIPITNANNSTQSMQFNTRNIPALSFTGTSIDESNVNASIFSQKRPRKRISRPEIRPQNTSRLLESIREQTPLNSNPTLFSSPTALPSVSGIPQLTTGYTNNTMPTFDLSNGTASNMTHQNENGEELLPKTHLHRQIQTADHSASTTRSPSPFSLTINTTYKNNPNNSQSPPTLFDSSSSRSHKTFSGSPLTIACHTNDCNNNGESDDEYYHDVHGNKKAKHQVPSIQRTYYNSASFITSALPSIRPGSTGVHHANYSPAPILTGVTMSTYSAANQIYNTNTINEVSNSPPFETPYPNNNQSIPHDINLNPLSLLQDNQQVSLFTGGSITDSLHPSSSFIPQGIKNGMHSTNKLKELNTLYQDNSLDADTKALLTLFSSTTFDDNNTNIATHTTSNQQILSSQSTTHNNNNTTDDMINALVDGLVIESLDDDSVTFKFKLNTNGSVQNFFSSDSEDDSDSDNSSSDSDDSDDSDYY